MYWTGLVRCTQCEEVHVAVVGGEGPEVPKLVDLECNACGAKACVPVADETNKPGVLIERSPIEVAFSALEHCREMRYRGMETTPRDLEPHHKALERAAVQMVRCYLEAMCPHDRD